MGAIAFPETYKSMHPMRPTDINLRLSISVGMERFLDP